MPRVKPKLKTNIFSNFEFRHKLWPYGSGRPVKAADARGWAQYQDRNFKVVQKFAPMPDKFLKFDREVVSRSLRLEREVQPHKVWKSLQYQVKSDYLRMAKMVLVFHNYGLNALELRKLRQVAKSSRCEWIQDKALGELYANYLGDDKLRPLLVDGDAILWAAYTTNDFKYITEKIVPYNYSLKLVAGLIVNPEFHSYRLLLPSELEAFKALPTTKSYIGDNLLGPLMAQPYSLVSTLMGSIAQLNNVLQFHLFKMKEAKKNEPKTEEKGEKKDGAKAEEKTEAKAGEKGEKKEGKPEGKAEGKGGEKKDGAKPEGKGEKKEGGAKPEGKGGDKKEGGAKPEGKGGEKKEGGAKPEAKGEKPKGEPKEKPKGEK
eukprot:Phypoly_transcript_11560.p1 GENE.Phypoly_transcript_11560~~Phypoly_transcript_11560.p1  ORF type:complete len:374 (+),score=85.90 Phypoly_transcript_11560:74-1195(+)